MTRGAAMLCAGLLTAWVAAPSRGDNPAPVAPTGPDLELHSTFWSNLHQFLYLLARAQLGLVPDRPTARAARADGRLVSRLSGSTRVGWTDALAFYEKHMARRTIWGELAAVNAQLAAAGDDSAAPALDVAGLAEALQKAAPAYRALWWPRHDSINRAWIRGVQRLRAAHGDRVAARISAAFHTPWPHRPIPVQVVAHATVYGAFEQDDPPIVHISSTYAAHRGSGGLEQLYHEAGHLIDDRVFQDLVAEASRRGRQVRPGTWRAVAHHILFLTAGVAVKEVIPDHVPYAEKWGVWDRSPELRQLLDACWLPYLEGRLPYGEAIRRIVAGAGR